MNFSPSSPMAATGSYTKRQQKQDFSDQKNQDNPTKFHYNFLYKAVVVSLFLIILPLFPSQAPEFVNQTLLTRSWELLHLLFVGIAISYGLFSRKNDDSEKDDQNNNNNNNNNNASKFDNAQTYVSRFLQVSSVFDDDSESASGSDENKVQTWSSQYTRNEPVVVVARENSVVEEERIGSKNKISRSVEKPLLLPVRSLKETSSVSHHSVSRSSSRRFSSNSNKSRNGEFGVLDREELAEEKAKESVVLPSPIPWRSRSGRLEMKEENMEGPAPFPSMEETEFTRVESRVSRSQSSRSSRSNSANSSPKLSAKKTSPSPSYLSLESQAKIAEDMVKKKSFYSKANPPPAPPPPPPPPPPPLFYRSSSSLKPSSESKDYSKRSHLDGLSVGKSVGAKGYESVSSEKKEDTAERVFAESDQEETESEDDDEIGQSFSQNFNGESVKKYEESGSSSVGEEGPDVDKKADEFIAKFREQIRLQRIESIKRSSAQMSRKLAR